MQLKTVFNTHFVTKNVVGGVVYAANRHPNGDSTGYPWLVEQDATDTWKRKRRKAEGRKGKDQKGRIRKEVSGSAR